MKRQPFAKRDKSGRFPSPRSTGPHPESIAVRERQLMEDGIILTFGKSELGREITKRTADDRLSGFTLGRLLLRHRQDPSNPSAISEAQFEAGEAWGKLVRQHASLHGYKLSIHTPSFVMVGGFGMSGTEPDHDTIMAIRQRWRACYDAIVERGIRTRDVLFGVVIEEWPASSLRPDDYGLLREGLNAIARAMR